MRYFIGTLALLALISLVFAAFNLGPFGNWRIRKHSHRELAGLLRPHYHIVTPTGEGPFPTVIGFHGCIGMEQGVLDWMDLFAARGFATVAVNSMPIRDVTPDEVCEHAKLLGSERAGDVLASIGDIRTLPFVDANRLALVGWSHGAWSVMDMIAMDPPTRLPANLLDSPPEPLKGVGAVVLFYPYCGYRTETRRRGWRNKIPSLLILAGRDRLTPGCRRAVSTLTSLGCPVTSHEYPEAVHAFDMRIKVRGQESAEEWNDPETTADARQRVVHFLDEVLRAGEDLRPDHAVPQSRDS